MWVHLPATQQTDAEEVAASGSTDVTAAAAAAAAAAADHAVQNIYARHLGEDSAAEIMHHNQRLDQLHQLRIGGEMPRADLQPMHAQWDGVHAGDHAHEWDARVGPDRQAGHMSQTVAGGLSSYGSSVVLSYV